MKKKLIVTAIMFLLTTIMSGTDSIAWEKIENWFVQEETDPFDDFPRVNAFLRKEFGNPSSSRLAISCRATRKTAIDYFPDLPNENYFVRGQLQVKSRVDSLDSETTNWFSNGNVVRKYETDAVDLLKQLYDSKKLALRVQGKSKIYTSVFELKGIQNVVNTVSSACDWQIGK